MITPRFQLSQTDKILTIKIRAPYSNLRELEVDVNENVFIFLSSPYYLRLHLPGNIIENDFTNSIFNADTGEFIFNYEKAIFGEHFNDLDLITKLLTPKIEVTDNGQRKIVVVSNETTETIKNDKEETNIINYHYGFAMLGHRNFNYISDEFSDVFKIDPKEKTLEERRKLRLQYEQGKFNVDHYISDFIEDDEIVEIINQQLPWYNEKSSDIKFSDSELDFLKDLTNIEYNLNEEQLQYCHCCLIDILFAYCYDRRTTYFEGSSESGWNIITLSASLSWLDGFKQVKEGLISAFRRCLIYPLYRNINLCQKILEDLKQLVENGEIFIIKCLIQMYDIFLNGDCSRYIINNLFIKDYIIYIMKWDKNRWNESITQLKLIEIKKSDLGLNLNEIEDGINNINNFGKLTIKESDSDDTDSDTSSDSDDSSSDCDTSVSGESYYSNVLTDIN